MACEMKISAVKRGAKVTFGSVEVRSGHIPAEIIKGNILAGQQALARSADRITKPGIKLRRQKGVPLFHVDPNDPSILIRELNGIIERGKLVNGQFEPL